MATKTAACVENFYSPNNLEEENMHHDHDENFTSEISFSTSQIIEDEEESVIQTIDVTDAEASAKNIATAPHNCCSHCEHLRAQVEYVEQLCFTLLCNQKVCLIVNFCGIFF